MRRIDAGKLVESLNDKLEGLRSEYRMTEGSVESSIAQAKISVLEDGVDAIERAVVE